MATCKITYNGNEISSSEQTAPVSITYDGRTITTISEGSSKTLNCNGKVMQSNVNVGSKVLNCSGKIMQGNIIVQVIASATAATITVSGRGDSKNCYATIGGTKRTGSWTGTVAFGSTITFGIWGGKNVEGTLIIDGTTVTSKKNGTATYNWTVPQKGIINISLSYNSNKNNGYGNITVTTS